MKVLISSCTHWWNAEAAYAAVLAETLLGNGHHVKVWSQPGTANEAQLLRRGLPVIRDIPPPGNNPLRWRGALTQLAGLQARENFQVVDVFRSQEFPLHLLASRGVSGPRVVRTRGSAQPVKAGWLNRKMYGQWCGGLIASSETVRAQMVSALRLSPELPSSKQLSSIQLSPEQQPPEQLASQQVRTIYYPIDLPQGGKGSSNDATAAKDKRDFLRGLALPQDSFVMGIVGRLYKEKGHALLLEAMQNLLKKLPDAALVIFAKDAAGEDPERPALEAQVKAAGLEARVRFTGFLDDIRRIMGWMDVGVVPSLASEVNCRVAVEFFSVGTPVVAFPTGALPEVVEHGVSGLVTERHSAAGLADALEKIARDKALREKLGKGARRQAEQRFSRSRFLEETLEVFEAALRKQPR